MSEQISVCVLVYGSLQGGKPTAVLKGSDPVLVSPQLLLSVCSGSTVLWASCSSSRRSLWTLVDILSSSVQLTTEQLKLVSPADEQNLQKVLENC